MLINDLISYKKSAGYNKNVSGIDQTGENNYSFNSWGFRGPEYDQYVGQAVNICLGDSFTVNVGGAIEHSWCSQLAEQLDIPTLNLGIDGAGNDTLHLVHNRACKLFNVQNTFVMYSYLHRRLKDGEFVQIVEDDDENFTYFNQQRLDNAIECALPMWNWSQSEKDFLNSKKLYFFNCKLYFSDHQHIDRKHIAKQSYFNLQGPDWPSLEDFQNGADPHPDMLTKEFGELVHYTVYCNSDSHHNNFYVNKIYANYLYEQWSKYES